MRRSWAAASLNSALLEKEDVADTEDDEKEEEEEDVVSAIVRQLLGSHGHR